MVGSELDHKDASLEYTNGHQIDQVGTDVQAKGLDPQATAIDSNNGQGPVPETAHLGETPASQAPAQLQAQLQTPVSQVVTSDGTVSVSEDDDDLVILDSQMEQMSDREVANSIANGESVKPATAVTDQVSAKKRTKTDDPQEPLQPSKKKKQEVTPPVDDEFEKALESLKLAFNSKQDISSSFISFIRKTVSSYKKDYQSLALRLAKIFLCIPESVYDLDVDYRYKGWRAAVVAVNDKTFWTNVTTPIRKFHQRARNWLSHDMRFKNYDFVLKSLTLMSDVGLTGKHLELFKIADLLTKVVKVSKRADIVKAATALLEQDATVAAPSSAKAHSTVSSIIKSMSAPKTNGKTAPVTKSSIFINDPHSNKNGDKDSKDNETAPPVKDAEAKPQKKVWMLSDYLSASTQKSAASDVSDSDKVKDEDPDPDVRVELKDGLFSILRKKSENDDVRKKRKAASKGVHFRDHDLVSVKIISAAYGRSEGSKVTGTEGSAMFGVTENEEVEWSTPIAFDNSTLPWYKAEYFTEIPVFRGGDTEVTSEDRDLQDARNATVPEARYDHLGHIPACPFIPDSLKILPPKSEEVVMIPFGNEGRD